MIHFSDTDPDDDFVGMIVETQTDEDDKTHLFDNVAVFTISGNQPMLKYDGYKYKRTLKLNGGFLWECTTKSCDAYICSDANDMIQKCQLVHNHVNTRVIRRSEVPDDSTTAVIINSRKGKEMLLYQKYTYRKQYTKRMKVRWVCSTLKHCKASLLTDHNNEILRASQEHCHGPPKYYLKPDHVVDALREPLV